VRPWALEGKEKRTEKKRGHSTFCKKVECPLFPVVAA